MNFVRKYIPKNMDESCNLWNEKLSKLMYEAYTYQEDQADLLIQDAPDWEKYREEYQNF